MWGEQEGGMGMGGRDGGKVKVKVKGWMNGWISGSQERDAE